MIENSQFQPNELQALVTNAPEAKVYPLATAFPVEQTMEIDNAYDVVQSQINEAASVTGFNAGAPLRSKGEGKKVLARLTKIQHQRRLDEVDLMRFDAPRNDAEKQQIIDKNLLSVVELSQGVDDAIEYIRAKMVYDGEFHFVDAINKSEIRFELERPAENKINVEKKWDAADSTPVSDLTLAVEQFKKTNGRKKPEVIVMNSTTYAAFKRSDEIKANIYGNATDARIVTDANVDALLNSVGLPSIVIDDSETGVRTVEGELEAVQHLKDGVVVLRSAVLGSTMVGPSKTSQGWVMGRWVDTYSEVNPPVEGIIAGEVALPVLKNLNGVVTLKVFTETP